MARLAGSAAVFRHLMRRNIIILRYIVKLRANVKRKVKLGPEIGSVMGWPTHPPDNFVELIKVR